MRAVSSEFSKDAESADVRGEKARRKVDPFIEDAMVVKVDGRVDLETKLTVC